MGVAVLSPVAAPATPDLVITTGTPTVSPATVAPGGSVTLSAWTVKNQGTAASGAFSNGFYLSPDPVITASDTYLTGNSNSSLAAGASFAWGGPTLTVPAATPPGTYYIGILVDRTGAVAESNEGNNYVSAVVTVPPTAVPDLVVSALTVSPRSPTPQDPLTFTVAARNQGTGMAGASTVTLRVGGETSPPGFAVPALAPGSTHTLTRTVGPLTSQSYLATATADAGSAVSESSESNNVTTLSFAVAPDTTPPAVFNVGALEVTDSTAVIGWQTDEPATGDIEFGPGTACPCPLLATPPTSTLVNTHALLLTGLSPGSRYFYRILSRDAAGNLATTTSFSFVTAPDTTPSVVSDVTVTAITSTSAVISWQTNEPASGSVEFGPGTPCPCPSLSPVAPRLATAQRLLLEQLAPSATYFFRVVSEDASGNASVSANFSFTTAPAFAMIEAVSGSTTARTTVETLRTLAPATVLPAGILNQTAVDASLSIRAPDASQFVMAPDSVLTLTPTGPDATRPVGATLIRGTVSFRASTAGAQTEPRIVTPSAKIRATGTACGVSYSQQGLVGTSVVTATEGICEVEDRRGQRMTLVANLSAQLEDVVPRVTLVLPVARGIVVRSDATSRIKNLLSWTSFPGAAGYLIEYAVRPQQSFVSPNAAAVEFPVNTVLLLSQGGLVTVTLPGAPTPIPIDATTAHVLEFREAQGIVELHIPLGSPSGTEVEWRVFPVDASGQVMPGAVASDAGVASVR